MRITEVISHREYPEYLYHGTSQGRLAKILKQGITSPSWWGSERIADYYAEEQSGEDGSNPIIITVPTSEFNEQYLEPDGNSIAEPLTHTLGRTEEDLYQDWQASGQTWLDCFDIYESVIYRGSLIRVTRQQVHKGTTAKQSPPTILKQTLKKPPDQQIINIYRGILAKIESGTPLEQNDHFMKIYVEKNFDTSGIIN